MKSRVLYIVALVAIFTPGVAFAWPWSWDMYVQPSHRAQRDSAPPQPEGIVPTRGNPYYSKDRADAARLKNPFPPTQASLDRGKQRYGIFCATCHGDGGKGDGPVGQKYVTPADLTSDYIRKKTDGDIYYTIEHGGLAVMPGYADSVETEDRWHIVNYIKNVFGNKGK